MADLPKSNLPVGLSTTTFKSDEARQKYIFELFHRWKHFQYDKWPVSLTLKPYDLDYYPNTPIFAVYLTDETKEHWVRFYLVNKQQILILEMFGDLRKFPADWFPTCEVTPEDVQAWLKRRYDHD